MLRADGIVDESVCRSSARRSASGRPGVAARTRREPLVSASARKASAAPVRDEMATAPPSVGEGGEKREENSSSASFI